MKNIILIAFVSLFCLMACSKEETTIKNPSSTTNPNILLVIADDVGVDAAIGYDVGAIKPNMPTLQNLINEGLTFDNVWAYPVCSPTRSSIISGKYGYHTGVLNAGGTIPMSEKTLQKYLDENTNNAYDHAIIGKWHLSNNEPTRPTDMGVGYYAGLLGGAVSDYNQWQFTENGQTSNYSGYITTKITDLAINWIAQTQKPWFCWVAYTAPHTPFHLPPIEMHSQGNLPTDQASIDANPLPYYMAMIESIDYEMNRLLQSLSSEELDNTIIVYIGDNGSPGQVAQAPFTSTQSKGTLYQGGIHVPMTISGKGVTRKNERDENLVSSTDLFATISEIAGASNPIYENSYSFKNLLTTATAGKREYNYSEILGEIPNKSGYTIRNKKYKYIHFDSGQERFFNLLSDPYENENLLTGVLSDEENLALQQLVEKANEIRQ